MREQHGYLSLPLMVRPNTILPVGANEDRPDYDYADGIELHVSALDEGATATARVPAHDGSTATTVEARRVGTRIEVSVQRAAPTRGRQPGSILLRGVDSMDSVEGGAAQGEALGTRLVPAEDVRRLVVHM